MRNIKLIPVLFALCLCPLWAAGADSRLDDLGQAILSNDLTAVKSLSESDLDLNRKDSEGLYPLEYIFVMENCQAFQILLENGADPSVKCGDGLTVREKVAETRNKTLIRILREEAGE